jgi:hypothetical protein
MRSPKVPLLPFITFLVAAAAATFFLLAGSFGGGDAAAEATTRTAQLHRIEAQSRACSEQRASGEQALEQSRTAAAEQLARASAAERAALSNATLLGQLSLELAAANVRAAASERALAASQARADASEQALAHAREQAMYFVAAPAMYGGGVGVENGEVVFHIMQQARLFSLSADGKLKLPPGTRRVWIDVGADWMSFTGNNGVYAKPFFAGRSFASLHAEAVSPSSTDLAFIAVDANDAYLTQLQRLPRTFAITAAVNLVEGTALFKDYAGPGCSSLLPPNERLRAAEMPADHPCRIVTRTRGVAVLRLESLLRLVPDDVRIELVKVDAQGVDLDVAMSAGNQLQRVERFVLEMQRVPRDDLRLLCESKRAMRNQYLRTRALSFSHRTRTLVRAMRSLHALVHEHKRTHMRTL